MRLVVCDMPGIFVIDSVRFKRIEPPHNGHSRLSAMDETIAPSPFLDKDGRHFYG